MYAPYDVELQPESEETLEIARIELRETPERIEEATRELRKLVEEATDLHYSTEDDFLKIFLRACHYYPESALKLFRSIAEFRKAQHNILHNLSPYDEKVAFTEYNVVNVLTKRDQKGRRILVVNTGETWDPKLVTSDQLFKIFYLIHLVAMLEPETQVKGVVCILDFKGLGMKQIKGMSPQFSMKLLTFIQDAMPLRMKEIHVVNQPFLFKLVFAMFKPFLREKLNKRMFFHGTDMKKLHEHIDPNYLPADYGGNDPKLNYTSKDWFDCISQYNDYLRKWNTYGFANAMN